ncbi:MAG: hypothetical protein PHT95_08660, partial [Candidatus Omnitrophica bacterium]|nr:hypothetical protein [Candidatus Omnitrophota bacterium]
RFDMSAKGKIALSSGYFTEGEHSIRFEWINPSAEGDIEELFLEDARYVSAADINSDGVVDGYDLRMFSAERAKSSGAVIDLYDPTMGSPEESDKTSYSVSKVTVNPGETDEYEGYKFTDAVTSEEIYSAENGRVVLGPAGYEFSVKEEDGEYVLTRMSRVTPADSEMLLFVNGTAYLYDPDTQEFTAKDTLEVVSVVNGIVSLGSPAKEYRVSLRDGRVALLERQDGGSLTGERILKIQETGFEDALALTDGATITREETQYEVSVGSDGKRMLTRVIENYIQSDDRLLVVSGGVYGITEEPAGIYSLASLTGGAEATVDNAAGTVQIGDRNYEIGALDAVRIKLTPVTTADISSPERLIAVGDVLYVISPVTDGQYKFVNRDNPADTVTSVAGKAEFGGKIYQVEKGALGELVLRRYSDFGTTDVSARMVVLTGEAYRIEGGPGTYVLVPFRSGAYEPVVDNMEGTVTASDGKVYSITGALDGNLMLIERKPESVSSSTRLIEIDSEFYRVDETQPGVFAVEAYSAGALVPDVDGNVLSIGDKRFTLTAFEDVISIVEMPDTVTPSSAKTIMLEGGIYEVNEDVPGEFSMTHILGADVLPVVDNILGIVTTASGNVYRIWEDAIYESINLEPKPAVSTPVIGEMISLSYGAGYSGLYSTSFDGEGKVIGFEPVMTTDPSGQSPAILVNAEDETASVSYGGVTTTYEITIDALSGAVMLAKKPIRSETRYNQVIEVKGLVYNVTTEPTGYTFREGDNIYTGTETEVTIGVTGFDIFVDPDTGDIRLTEKPLITESVAGDVKSTYVTIIEGVSQPAGTGRITLRDRVFDVVPGRFGGLLNENTD